MEQAIENSNNNSNNPYDINGQHFNSDLYLQELFRVIIFLYKLDAIKLIWFIFN